MLMTLIIHFMWGENYLHILIENNDTCGFMMYVHTCVKPQNDINLQKFQQDKPMYTIYTVNPANFKCKYFQFRNFQRKIFSLFC